MMPSVNHRGGPYCGTRRKTLRSSRCVAWPAGTARRRLLFPLGWWPAKDPRILHLRRVRGSLCCLSRSAGRTPLISYVFIVQSCGEAFDEYVSQFTATLSYSDPFTVHFASAASSILVLYGLYAFAGRGVTVTVSQSIVLQVCPRFSPLFLVISHHHNQLLGILLAKAALPHPSQSHRGPPLVLLVVAFTSACNILVIDDVPFTLPLPA
jgi:hypothetical protein